MKLLFLLTLVLGGFSLPAHASKQLDKCADHKLMLSNSGTLYLRRLDTGEAVYAAPKTNMDTAKYKMGVLCSDR